MELICHAQFHTEEVEIKIIHISLGDIKASASAKKPHEISGRM